MSIISKVKLKMMCYKVFIYIYVIYGFIIIEEYIKAYETCPPYQSKINK